jgi:hypothetical protein
MAPQGIEPATSQLVVIVIDSNVKAIPLKAWTDLGGSRRLRLPYFKKTKVVKLSALLTGHLYLPENIPGTHFC